MEEKKCVHCIDCIYYDFTFKECELSGENAFPMDSCEDGKENDE